MLNNFDLGFMFRAVDKVTPVSRRVNNSLRRTQRTAQQASAMLNKSFIQIGKGLMVLYGAVKAYRSITAPLKSYGEFQYQLEGVGIASEATAESMVKLKNAAIDAGIITKYDPTDAARALRVLAQDGYTAEQSMSALTAALDLAAASMGDITAKEATTAISSSLKTFRMETERATEVADKLYTMTIKTRFSTEDFARGLSNASAKASSFNYGLEDTLITMGALRQVGLKATRAATAIGAAMKDIAGQTPRTTKLFKELGVRIFHENGKLRRFTTIITELHEAMAGMTDQQRAKKLSRAFGVRGLVAVDALRKITANTVEGVEVRGRQAINALQGYLNNATGVVRNARERLNDTIKGQYQLIKGSYESLKIMIGETMAPLFKPVLNAIYRGLNAIIRALQALPAPLKKVLGGFMAILALTAGLVVLVTVISLLVIAIKMLATYVSVFLIPALLPLLPLLIPLGLIALGLFLIYKAYKRNLGGFADSVNNVAKELGLVLSSMWELISTGEIVGDKVNKIMERPWLFALLQFVATLRQAIISIGEGIAVGWKLAAPFEALALTITIIKDTISETVGTIKDAFKELSLGVQDVTAESSESFNVLSKIGEFIGAMIGGALRGAIIIMAMFVRVFTAKIQFIIAKFTRLGQFIGGVIYFVTGRWKKGLDNMGGAIGGFVVDVFNIFGSLIYDLIRLFLNFFHVSIPTWKEFKETLGGIFVDLGKEIVSFFDWALSKIEWLADKAKGAWDWVSDKTSSGVEKVKNFFTGDTNTGSVDWTSFVAGITQPTPQPQQENTFENIINNTTKSFPSGEKEKLKAQTETKPEITVTNDQPLNVSLKGKVFLDKDKLVGYMDERKKEKNENTLTSIASVWS